MSESFAAPTSSASAVAAAAAVLLPDAGTEAALYIVSTPIGHLGDISLRALAVLQQVALICCEDTRQSRTLLARYGITTPTRALHEHNEAQATQQLLARLTAGDAIALISDAGTPLVSDPGARLVAAAADVGLRVVPVPGASATLAALVASGIAPHPCTMFGFPPRKQGERLELFTTAAVLRHAVVFFEAPGRLVDTLGELAEVAGPARRAVVARELTKHYEEIRRGTLTELAAYYKATGVRGEIVLVLEGAPAPTRNEQDLTALAHSLRAEGRRARDVVQLLMDEHGASRNLAYRIAHQT